MSHIFDADQCAVKLLPCVTEDSSNPQIWLCLDNTSVIWGIRGSAAASSNWAYNRCHELLRQHNVGLKWAPGHMGIEGNEEADRLAKRAVSSTAAPAYGLYRPTVEYQVKAPPELTMPRHALHRWLALRSSHGDFSWYHRRFQHADARLTCVCGHNKSPEHLVLCRHSQRHFLHWPKRPAARPHNRATAVAYLGVSDPYRLCRTDRRQAVLHTILHKQFHEAGLLSTPTVASATARDITVYADSTDSTTRLICLN
ncbi:predicted protein [Histoplasma mississippiense (nom. inval.)]|uniref:predicted protein n=1 Tax=Ajellomyces capsulatus (strain NAm1 / WU24) TaxID=2059318 RepID=UPI000157D5AB|nr:predicted protein [Histoplasma mississippiense (nom. inval.)]EDN05447.1 predicted protein [Histoplasma mississippiense (nom. inval.)]